MSEKRFNRKKYKGINKKKETWQYRKKENRKKITEKMDVKERNTSIKWTKN